MHFMGGDQNIWEDFYNVSCRNLSIELLVWSYCTFCDKHLMLTSVKNVDMPVFFEPE